MTGKILVAGALAVTMSARADEIRLITLDPGHFHAALVQKARYPQVSPVVHVYAPAGPDLDGHLNRIAGFNLGWEEKVYTGPDFLDKMLREKPGNVVVISGNNARKTEYIYRCVDAGLNVLADKPMAIDPAGFELLNKAFQRAHEKNVLLYDIMTERYEITTILQRALSQNPAVFGKLDQGTPEQPAITKESVHHYSKEVAGKPLTRPAWFFDVTQQGEALPDVGTHMVDLIQWECFPDQTLSPADVKVLTARRWSTKLTPEQFKKTTGLEQYPDYLKAAVDPDHALSVCQNGEMVYWLRGIYAKVSVLWNFEAPPGAKDTHYSIMRGTEANLVIKQGKDQTYKPTLYVENKSGTTAAKFEQTLRSAVTQLAAAYPGVDVQKVADGWQIMIPEKYSVSHEAHFAQVTEKYLRFLAEGTMPQWEVPNMLVKYATTTQAYAVSHAAPKAK